MGASTNRRLEKVSQKLTYLSWENMDSRSSSSFSGSSFSLSSSSSAGGGGSMAVGVGTSSSVAPSFAVLPFNSLSAAKDSSFMVMLSEKWIFYFYTCTTTGLAVRPFLSAKLQYQYLLTSSFSTKTVVHLFVQLCLSHFHERY